MRQVDLSELNLPEDSPFDAYVMDSDEDWVEYRTSGIGGSDVAAIMGISKYRSPLEVWLEKTGRRKSPDLSGKESVEWGNRLEGVIRDKFAEMHPELSVSEVKATLVSKERPWAHANLDGMVVDGSGNHGILEIKTVGKAREGDWDKGVPDYYITQVTHYMTVTGWGFAYVAALIGGQRYVEYRIDRDEEDVVAVAGAVNSFWNLFVKPDQMPAIVGMKSEAQALADQYPSATSGDEYVSSHELQDLFNTLAWDYEQAKADEDRAKRAKDEAANKMRAIIGDNKSVSTDIYRATWVRNTTTRFDSKRFAAEHPDLYEQYCTTFQRDGGIRIKELGR